MQVEEPISNTSQVTCSSFSYPSTSSSFELSNLKLIKKIGESKYPVLLVYSPEADRCFALKLFPWKDNKISSAYINESRFHVLSHPNIVSMLKVFDKQKSMMGNNLFCCSCILMEYAPFGDFSELLLKNKLHHDEVMIRTFFHQFINGLEYLHSNEIAHLDIKLENLLLGQDLMLKITDFDMAHSIDDIGMRGKGTSNYRAPELRALSCKNTKAADIYSAGILLFVLKTGTFPYIEDSVIEGHDLFKLMTQDSKSFWDIHEALQKRETFNDDFKNLFMSMIKLNPADRASLEDIKASEWYQGPTYSAEELYYHLCTYGVINIDLSVQTD